MVSKTVLFLTLIGACLAIPVEEVKPPVGAPEHGPLVGPGPLAQPGEQIPEGVNPEDIDLKTDATHWWRRSYYPSYRIYRRYPSVYSYYAPSYYWNSHW